jgi:hypothetical protein
MGNRRNIKVGKVITHEGKRYRYVTSTDPEVRKDPCPACDYEDICEGSEALGCEELDIISESEGIPCVGILKELDPLYEVLLKVKEDK